MPFLWWAVGFFVLAILVSVIGFRGVGGVDMEIAKWLVLIFVVLAVIALVLSTPGAEPEPTEEPTLEQPDEGEITRYVDHDADVVCYLYYEEGAEASGAGWASGMSCLPLNQTALTPGGDA